MILSLWVVGVPLGLTSGFQHLGLWSADSFLIHFMRAALASSLRGLPSIQRPITISSADLVSLWQIFPLCALVDHQLPLRAFSRSCSVPLGGALVPVTCCKRTGQLTRMVL